MSNIFWPTFLVTTIVTFFIVVQFHHTPTAQSNLTWTDGKGQANRNNSNHAWSSVIPKHERNTTYLVHGLVAREISDFLRREKNTPTAEKPDFNKPLPERPASREPIYEKPISISLIRQRNTWLIPIGVGTPPQQFPVMIDTSSSDSWVFTTEFKNKEYQTQRKYDPSKSGTADKIASRTFQLPCRGGVTAKGETYRDTMTFAGTEFKLTEQYFVGTTKLSGVPPQPRFYGGILGLAHPALSSRVGKPSFIHNAVLENVISKPIFAFYLSRSQSELHLGGTDRDFYTGDIQYSRVYTAKLRGFDYPFYWFIPGGQINVNNEKGLILGVHAAIDIRTAFIRGPREEVKLVYASMGVEHQKIHGFYVYPCEKVPSVSFQWENKKWVLSSENFKLEQLTSNPAMCAGVIQEDSRLTRRRWILGAWFMMNVYTVFDADSETPRVGFGAPQHSVS